MRPKGDGYWPDGDGSIVRGPGITLGEWTMV